MDANDTAIHAELQRDVGRLEGKVETMGASVAAMDEKLDRVLAHIERDKGGRKALATIGAIGGSIAGAVFGALVSWFAGKAP